MTTKIVTKTNYVNCQNCGTKIDNGKFCSDICEKWYNKEPKGAKPLQAIEERNNVHKYCKNCNKELPKGLDAHFCSAKCIREYRFKKEHPDKVMNDGLGRTFVKAEYKSEVEESATEYMKRRKVEKKAGKKTEQKQVKNNGLDKPVFWMKGDGMIRREHNIDEVKRLILSGLSYQDIIRISRKHFQSSTINEYYEIAFDEINGEIKNES